MSELGGTDEATELQHNWCEKCGFPLDEKGNHAGLPNGWISVAPGILINASLVRTGMQMQRCDCLDEGEEHTAESDALAVRLRP